MNGEVVEWVCEVGRVRLGLVSEQRAVGAKIKVSLSPISDVFSALHQVAFLDDFGARGRRETRRIPARHRQSSNVNIERDERKLAEKAAKVFVVQRHSNATDLHVFDLELYSMKLSLIIMKCGSKDCAKGERKENNNIQ